MDYDPQHYHREQYWQGRERFWKMLAMTLFFTPVISAINRGCDSFGEYRAEKKQQEIINSIPEAKKLQENFLEIKNSLDSRLALTTTVYYANLGKIIEEHKAKQESEMKTNYVKIDSLKHQTDSLENRADSLRKEYKTQYKK